MEAIPKHHTCKLELNLIHGRYVYSEYMEATSNHKSWKLYLKLLHDN